MMSWYDARKFRHDMTSDSEAKVRGDEDKEKLQMASQFHIMKRR